MVISIITLLISILLPALKAAREQVLYAVFADYNATPTTDSVNVATGAAHGKSRAETIKEILRITDKATEGRPEILKAVWRWQRFFGQDDAAARFMEEIAAMGYGPFYNEAGNADDWILFVFRNRAGTINNNDAPAPIPAAPVRSPENSPPT